MTAHTRQTILFASAFLAAVPPIVVWFVFTRWLVLADVTTLVELVRGAVLILAAIFAPCVSFVCACLAVNRVHQMTSKHLRS